jgi:hypothetical protein
VITKAALGFSAAIASIGGIGGLQVYQQHRMSDMTDNYVDLKREQAEIVRSINDMHVNILTAIRDKQEACKVLEATVSTKKYSHSYCKDEIE